MASLHARCYQGKTKCVLMAPLRPVNASRLGGEVARLELGELVHSLVELSR